MVVGSQTNVDIVLRPLIALVLPRTADALVSGVGFYADDPRAFVRAAQPYISSDSVARPT
jgi:hypothetical protein